MVIRQPCLLGAAHTRRAHGAIAPHNSPTCGCWRCASVSGTKPSSFNWPQLTLTSLLEREGFLSREDYCAWLPCVSVDQTHGKVNHMRIKRVSLWTDQSMDWNRTWKNKGRSQESLFPFICLVTGKLFQKIQANNFPAWKPHFVCWAKHLSQDIQVFWHGISLPALTSLGFSFLLKFISLAKQCNPWIQTPVENFRNFLVKNVLQTASMISQQRRLL